MSSQSLIAGNAQLSPPVTGDCNAAPGVPAGGCNQAAMSHVQANSLICPWIIEGESG